MDKQTLIITVFNEVTKTATGQIRVRDDLSYTTSGSLKNVDIICEERTKTLPKKFNNNPVVFGLRFHFSKFSENPLVGKMVDVVRDYIVHVIYK